MTSFFPYRKYNCTPYFFSIYDFIFSFHVWFHFFFHLAIHLFYTSFTPLSPPPPPFFLHHFRKYNYYVTQAHNLAK